MDSGHRKSLPVRVVRKVRINEDVWSMVEAMTIASGKSKGEFLEPIIKNAYKDWVEEQARSLHSRP